MEKENKSIIKVARDIMGVCVCVGGGPNLKQQSIAVMETVFNQIPWQHHESN